MQGDLYIVVTNTYLNKEYDLFTATEDNFFGSLDVPVKGKGK